MKKVEAGCKQRGANGRRRGFSFTEVLFAVMVLGIGFIMIAAMFPITIRQTQNTMQETQAADVAKGALAYLQSMASAQNFPVTFNGPVERSPLFSLKNAPASTPPSALSAYLQIRGNFVVPNNPRIAWVPLYRRGKESDGTDSPYAQVIILVMQSRNRPQYYVNTEAGRNYTDFDVPASGTYATLDPHLVRVIVHYNSALQRAEARFPVAADQAAVAPLSYLVIANDPNKNPPLNEVGQSNGRIYQIGNYDEANGCWELVPGATMIRTGSNPDAPIPGDDNELPDDSSPSKQTFAYMIGRGYSNPVDASEGFAGPAQDIGIYTGFIQISR